MTTTDLTAAENQLREPIYAVPQFNGNWSAVTIGACAAGGDLNLPLADNAGARHIVITGTSGTGKTALLRSLLAGAADAGIEGTLIDPYQGDAREVAERYAALVAEGRKGQPLHLLLVDELDGLDATTVKVLEVVVRSARRANVALLVAAQDVRMGGRAGAVLQHLTDAPLVRFTNPGAPGVGEANGAPFRAWYAA